MVSTGCLLVAYDFSDRKQKLWSTFLNRSGLNESISLVIENAPYDNIHAEKGSNTYFEFSGYLEGLEKIGASDLNEVFIFNDTLFEHHAISMWANYFQNIKLLRDGIYGDGRIEPVIWDSKPLRILASWHFLLKGKVAIDIFDKTLKEVLLDFDKPLIINEEYKTYRERYLSGTFFNGYSLSGKLDSKEDIERKIKCIGTEHRLGRALDENSVMIPYSGFRYGLVHLVDRFLSFKRRFKSKVFS
jgi:hypothetical protein